MKTNQPRVLGAGLVALDLVVSSNPDSAIQAWAGGTCGNVMSMLAWHGWEAYPIARMNGDAASQRAKADLARWGVKLDLTACGPVTSTPIVVQQIRRNRAGIATHKFSWSCLRCGGWLPSFKPVTQAAVDEVRPYLPGTAVFFMDRLSRGTIDLAREAVAAGAIVMFEPSGRGDDRLFSEALELAHVVKYADQRMSNLADDVLTSNRLLEVQTLGADGLRFRTPHKTRASGWRSLAAVPAPAVVDSCGAGDWCTAGLLAQIGAGGSEALKGMTLKGITEGLRYGQELAAWNCGFEGARGGMYQDGTHPLRRRTPIAPSVHAAAPNASALVECPKCDVA